MNPLQFGEEEDLDRYPRTLEADLDLLAECGVDVVFAPGVDEVYPDGEPMVRITAGEPRREVRGGLPARPLRRRAHRGGQAAASSVLPAGDADYRTYFGQKDAQQLVLVKRMVADLNFPVDVVGVPIVRDDDGLALSSRNRFLSEAEREAALVLSRSLAYLRGQAERHEALDIDGALAMIDSAPLVQPDYLEVVDPKTLEPLAFNCRETPFTGEALALVAAKVGPVRLIDNVQLGY